MGLAAKLVVMGSAALLLPHLVFAAPEAVMTQKVEDDAPVKTILAPQTNAPVVPEKESLPPLPVKADLPPKVDTDELPRKLDVPLPPMMHTLPTKVGEQKRSKTDIVVAPDGKSIQLVGTIFEGMAQRLGDALHDNPNVKTLVLTSDGGILVEGAGLAHLVRKYGLDTHVEFLCASACTFPLLAGKNRSMAPGALIGFHQASTFFAPLMSTGAQTSDEPGNRMMRSVYAAAKLGDPFIDKALATPPNDLWFPDAKQLQANAVITRMAGANEYPMKLGEWAVASDFVRELEKDPLWVAARLGKPEHYSFAIGAAWMLAANAKDNEAVKRSARILLVRRLLADAQAYPDALLLEYAALEKDIWDELGYYDGGNRDCEYGAVLRFPVGVTSNEAHKKRQLALYKKMIAAPVDVSLPDSAVRAQAQADMMVFWGLMIAEHGFSSFSVASNFCREPRTYFEELSKMPDAERLKLLRSLLLMQSTTLRG